MRARKPLAPGTQTPPWGTFGHPLDEGGQGDVRGAPDLATPDLVVQPDVEDLCAGGPCVPIAMSTVPAR